MPLTEERNALAGARRKEVLQPAKRAVPREKNVTVVPSPEALQALRKEYWMVLEADLESALYARKAFNASEILRIIHWQLNGRSMMPNTTVLIFHLMEENFEERFRVLEKSLRELRSGPDASMLPDHIFAVKIPSFPVEDVRKKLHEMLGEGEVTDAAIDEFVEEWNSPLKA